MIIITVVCRNFRQEKIFSNFAICFHNNIMHWWKFYQDMATFMVYHIGEKILCLGKFFLDLGSIICLFTTYTASICTHNDLRLFGAESDYQYGIAEICINGFWADICYTGSYATTASKFCDEYYFGINSC